MSRERALRAAYLVAVTVLGAWLRLRELGLPSFWFDEIFHYDLATAAARQPLWRWLTIFEVENGPLFYAGQLLGRISHSPEFSARIAPALCGIATIPLLWLAARAIPTFRALPYAAALLMAVSPLHVYYSREARPYALVVLVSAALLLASLRHTRIRYVLILMLIAIYSAAVIAPVIAAVIVAASLAALIVKERRFWWTVAAAATACAISLVVFYRPGRYPAQEHVASIDWSTLRGLAEAFSVVAVDTASPHRAAFLFLIMAMIGAVALLRNDRQQGVIAASIGLLPVAIGVTATWLLHRPFGVRYVIGGLPGYVLLVAAGVSTVVSGLHRWRADALAGIVAAALLARQGWKAAIEEPFQKLDWRTIARTIARHAHEDDAVIAGEVWTGEQLGFYLRGLKPHVRVFNAGGTQTMGEVFAYQHTTSWLVVADTGNAFARWTCRFPVVLASPLQNFRLHYSPSRYYFLTDRSTPAEHRALLASNARAGMSTERTTYVAVPMLAAGDHAVTFDIDPRAEAVAVSVNDQSIATLQLSPRQRSYSFLARFRAGMNIVRFDFDRKAGQVAFDAAPVVRLDEGEDYLDENSVWRREGGRPLPANVDRAKLERLLGRLGLDPERAVVKLTSGRVTLANLATTLADDSVCDDDGQFLSTLFMALLGRPISERELRDFGDQLRAGVPRRTIAWRLGNADECHLLLR